jgi:hypothetical protein
MVEAAGIEPASEEATAQVSTCVARRIFSPPRLPRTEAVGRPAREFSRFRPGHSVAASPQNMTPDRRPWEPNRRGRAGTS